MKRQKKNRGHGRERRQLAALLHNGPRVVPQVIGGDPFSILAFEEWMQRSACREVDPELFYPGPGEYDKSRAAKRVCAHCPVVADCLAHAMRTHEPFGIWGGKSYVERRRVAS